MNDELRPATCIACRESVWISSVGKDARGNALAFDLVAGRDQSMLFVHGCHFEESPEDEDCYDPELDGP